MSSRRNFEFMLLSCMTPTYRSSVLDEIGVVPSDAARAAKQCALSFPRQLNVDLDDYIAILGKAAAVRALDSDLPDMFLGSTGHFFSLALWPHLYWVVNQTVNGSTWGCGFQNQATLYLSTIDPSLIRPGVWTQSALQKVADDMQVSDGWDEVSTVRFAFGHQEYVGEFVFQLLQSWKRPGASL